jgi:hypothetical protein
MTLLLIALLWISLSTTLAQIDPLPNGIGFYFDEGAMNNSINAEIGATVHAYAVATRLTHTGMGSLWWTPTCLMEFLAGDPQSSTGICLTYEVRGGVNIPTPTSGCEFRFGVVYEDPFPITENMVLADLWIDVPSMDPIGLYMMAAGSGLEFMDGEVLELQCHWETVGDWNPHHLCATINGEAPASDAYSSWGSVKALYR